MNNKNNNNQLGMKWHSIYNIFLIIFGDFLILISPMTGDETIAIIIVCACLFIIFTALTTLWKTEEGYALTKILNFSYIGIAGYMVYDAVCLICENSTLESFPNNNIGTVIFIAIPFITGLILLSILNNKYYKKRKHLFNK